MKKSMIALVTVISIPILLLVIIVNFTEYGEHILDCQGEITTLNSRTPATAHLKLVHYRWWVKLWSGGTGADGQVIIEIPSHGITSGYIDVNHYGYRFSTYTGGVLGILSTVSNTVIINSPAAFSGTCTNRAGN